MRPKRSNLSVEGAMLRAAGTALFGERWQSSLARELEVSDRTVRRWLGTGDIPKGIWAEIESLMDCSQMALTEVRERLRKATKKERA